MDESLNAYVMCDDISESDTNDGLQYPPDTRTPEQIDRDNRVQKQVAEFKAPKNFAFVLPNLMIGTFSKLTRAKDYPPGMALSAEQQADNAYNEKLIEKLGCEYVIFFSSKLIDIDTSHISEILNDFHPLEMPNAFGEAKVVFVHNDTWRLIEGYSHILRTHPSLKTPHISEAYEIYAMNGDAAYSMFVEDKKCARCSRTPSPIMCQTCGIFYCSPSCQANDKEDHGPTCVANIMESLTLTVKQKRDDLNARIKKFISEQKQFEDRNRGKLVTVKRMDADKKWIETEEIVLPDQE